MKQTDRICCDGLCQQAGNECPVLRFPRPKACRAHKAMQLAPGVIDGPHKAPPGRFAVWMRRVTGCAQP